MNSPDVYYYISRVASELLASRSITSLSSVITPYGIDFEIGQIPASLLPGSARYNQELRVSKPKLWPVAGLELHYGSPGYLIITFLELAVIS